MHCNTLKQDNDSTVRGDGEVGSAVCEGMYGLTHSLDHPRGRSVKKGSQS